MKAEVQKPRLWPRYAIGPKGARARIDCIGDMPHGWHLEVPLPEGDAPEFEVPGADLKAARAAYQAKFGKRPWGAWDVATIRAKLAERA